MSNAADIFQVVLTALIMLLTIFGNAAICVVIYRVRRLHCPSGFLLANLAVIDILVALTLLPFRIPGILYGIWVFSDSGCMILGFLQNTLSMASVLTLLAVTVDRYLAIVISLHYNSWVTVTKTVFCIGGVWVYAAISACYPFVGWGKYSFLPGLWLCETDYLVLPSFTYFKLCTMYFLPLILILYLYSKIVRVAWRHSKQIRLEVEAINLREASVSTVQIETFVGNMAAVSGQFCLRNPHSAKRSEIKTAITLAIVVGVLFLSWTPFIVQNLLSFHKGENSSTIAREVTSYLYYINALLNPYIYGYLNRAIKLEIKKLFEKSSSWAARLKSSKVNPAIVVVAPED